MSRTLLLVGLLLGVASELPSQRASMDTTGTAPPAAGLAEQRSSFGRAAVHYGKWLTAGATVAFTLLAAHEHSYSRRDWDALLAICRSAVDACVLGSDGRYVRPDAELLYQRSRWYDRRANVRLLGAQASLLATATLFILDLHPGRRGPDNIPFSPIRVGLSPTSDGAAVEMRIAF